MSFEILVEDVTGDIVGLGPFPEPAEPGYTIYEIADDAEYDKACADDAKYDPRTGQIT